MADARSPGRRGWCWAAGGCLRTHSGGRVRPTSILNISTIFQLPTILFLIPELHYYPFTSILNTSTIFQCPSILFLILELHYSPHPKHSNHLLVSNHIVSHPGAPLFSIYFSPKHSNHLSVANPIVSHPGAPLFSIYSTVLLLHLPHAKYRQKMSASVSTKSIYFKSTNTQRP